MRKFLIITFLAFIIFPQQAFSLTYDKKIQKTGVVFSDGSSGRSKTEGFFGYGETSSCRKYNYTLQQVRQGQTIFYKNNNSVSSIEKGLFDCALDQNNKPMYTLREGVGLHIESGETQVFYKHDSINLYAYIKNKEGVWHYVTRNIDSAFWTQTNSNRFIRLATTDEIKQAESLYKFYNNLDLSSRSAKIYGDKIYK